MSLAACGGSVTVAPTASGSATAASTSVSGKSAASGASTQAASAAVNTTASAAKPAGSAVHITYMISSTGNLVMDQTYTAIADSFTKSQQAVAVDVHKVTGNFNQELQVELAGGVPPDVFFYLQENIPIPALVGKQIGFPLDTYIARDKYDSSDFLPQAWALNVWQGKVYAIPRDYGNQQIYYNVELFNAAGIPPIPADWTDTTWTFDAYVAAAQKLTKQEGGKTTVWGCLVNEGWRPWATFVYSNGGTVVDQDANGVSTDISLTSDAAVGGLQFLQDLIYTHKVAPHPDVASQQGQLQLFASSKVGMVLDNSSGAGNYRKNLSFKWDVGAVPLGHAAKRGSGGGGTAWAITQPSTHHDQSWAFLQWLTSADSQRLEARAGVTTPSRQSVVRSADFLQPSLAPAHSVSFANAQPYVVRDPVSAAWPQIQSQIVTKQLDSLWDDSKDAKTVAALIKQQADPVFKSGS
jgi:multiple sugar transport system substrate-binding protein